MRLTRIFLDEPLAPDALLPLPAGATQHVAHVLRATAGDPLILFNGQGGEYAASIQSLRRHEVLVRIGAHRAIERESPLATTLLQGIARGEKMDQILQKATELGVTRVYPVLAARGNVRLDEAAARRKHEHWQGVAINACEQCGRNRVPQVAPPMSLAAALDAVQAGLKLVLEPDGAAPLCSLLDANSVLHPVALLAGPEGGLTQDELAAARQAGFVSCRLGPRVLRTETAAPAALAALQFAVGDFGDDAE